MRVRSATANSLPIVFIAAFSIAAVLGGILLGRLDFPLGTSPDEIAKVRAILDGNNPSYHPVLMLEVVRVARAWKAATTPQSIAELGRACAAVAAGIAVFASFLLAREVLPKLTALAATAAVAVVPLMTVHARYFKEDVFMLPFLLLALIALIRCLRSPTPFWGILLGTAIGCAAGAKYIGAVLLPFSVVCLLLAPCFDNRESRIKFIALVTVVATTVFLLIELPVFWELAQFRRAVLAEMAHAAHGHDVRLPVILTYGLFHLRESLLPGLGWPLLTLGMLGLTTAIWAPPERRQGLLVIAGFALVWYAIHELTPLKPFPGFARYTLPLAPLLIILGAAFIRELSERYLSREGDLLAAVIVVIAALPAFRLSVLINGPSADDPRSAVPLIANLQPMPSFDRYTQFMGLQSNPSANLFVTSSFRYERYIRFGDKPFQREFARYRTDYYKALFQLPYLEVTNGRPSFAFFNPVIRIVALDGDVHHLETVATTFSLGHADHLTIRLMNADKPDGRR